MVFYVSSDIRTLYNFAKKPWLGLNSQLRLFSACWRFPRIFRSILQDCLSSSLYDNDDISHEERVA